MVKEQWRDIAGFAGYQVSDAGRVRSKRLTVQPGGIGDTWHFMKPYKNRGYFVVGFCQGLGKRRDKGAVSRKLIHVLVLEAFRGSRRPGMFASHLDGNRCNNILENLQWETHAQNEARKVDHGTILRGSAHARAKLCEASAKQIRLLYAAGTRTTTQLAADYGVGFSTIRHLLDRDTWTHV